MKVEKREHEIWRSYYYYYYKQIHDIPFPFPFTPSLPGKWQYIYTSDDRTKEISLIELPDYFMNFMTLWEIYCLKGDLFDGVERFDSKEGAEEAILTYFNETKIDKPRKDRSLAQ